MQGLTVKIRRRASGSGRRWPVLVATTLLLGACASSTTTGRSDTGSSPAGSSDVQASPTQPPSAEVEPAGAELASDGLWVLQAGTVDGEPLAVEADAAVTMDFGDRQVGGQSACNGYGAEFDVDGDQLSIMVTDGTDMGCREAVEALEDAYLDALPRITSFDRQADDRLVLTGDGVELVFVTEPSVDVDALVGRTWELLALRNGESTQEAEGGGFIIFEENGTVTGSTGCQEYEGSWTQDGSDIVFDSLSLDGQCDAGPDLRQQHAAVAGPMFTPLTVTVSDDELVLATRHGSAMVYWTESDDPDPAAPAGTTGSSPAFPDDCPNGWNGLGGHGDYGDDFEGHDTPQEAWVIMATDEDFGAPADVIAAVTRGSAEVTGGRLLVVDESGRAIAEGRVRRIGDDGWVVEDPAWCE